MLGFLLCTAASQAQLVDASQVSPTVPGGTIARSLEQQIGPGRGDASTAQSSVYLIKRDPARAIRRGRQLFQRKFTLAQGLGPRVNVHSSGNIQSTPALGAGLSDSCASCHGRPRGSAGHGGVVNTRPDSRDAPHLFGLGLQEMLADEMTTELRNLEREASNRARTANRPVRQALHSKGVSFGSIIAHPDGTVDTTNVDGIDSDLRVRPFFAQGGGYSIREFIVGAFKDEMGLENADPDLLTASLGSRVVTPSGLTLDGAIDRVNPPSVVTVNEDGDGDGVTNELDPALIDYLEFYLLNYFKPGKGKSATGSESAEAVASASGQSLTSDRRRRASRGRGRSSTRQNENEPTVAIKSEHPGRRLLRRMECTQCHVPDLTVDRDRRVADVETVYDPARGIFNRLFATATPLFEVQPLEAGQEYPQLLPKGEPFVVKDIYTDFKRHDLGEAFWERQYDGSVVKEFVTEPLWGVGSTAPYGHDGRSINLEEVILRHGGEAERSKNLFARARQSDQEAVIEYLSGLVLFPPDDTASNLNPGDASGYVQDPANHGSINLSALFQIPDPDGLGE